MRVTTKGQVTIPQHIREKLGILPATEIEFVEEKDRVYIVKKEDPENQNSKFRKMRGVATIRMTTDEIMALTRKDQ
jgi:AbrB family looped-hinge helix DNA binding protein